MRIIDRFNICNVVKPGFAAHCIGKPFLAKQVSLTENDYFLQNVGCAHCT